MSVRTVRYYVQRGLLPAPAFRGKDTAYAHEHLVRLKAIRRLQEAYFPLDAIAGELASRSLAEIERIADGSAMPAMPGAPGAAAVAAASAPASDYRRAGGSVRGGDEGDEEARAAIAAQAERVYRSVPLFPGVDLTVADDAPAESVRLVQRMLAILEATLKVNEGGRKR